MTTDFHLFPSLPQELQDHIWSLAVRPLPGTHHVHSFYLADHYVNKATISDEYQADFLHFTAGRRGWSLGVPREGNRSAYALDIGLWHACRQSRKALLNHFRSNKYWAAPLDEFQPSPSAEIDIYNDKPSSISPNTHTGVYIDSNNKKQYITIFPQTDLVHILDPVDHEWFHHYAGDYAPVFDAPECRWGASEGGPGFVGRNVAVDFEPSWAVDFEPRWRVEIPGSVEDMIDVLYTEAVRTVWFIDSRLKRKTQDGGVGSTHGMVFYGWGYRLVEVKREEMGLWEMDTPGKTAFDFFDRLESDSNGRLEVDDPERLRVLAYQSI